MDILAAIGGVSTLAIGVVAWALWQRSKGLKAESKAARKHQLLAEIALEDNAEEFSDYRRRSEAKEALLVSKLEHYENHELDAIEEEPDRKVRIGRRRSWVAGLLSEASKPAHRIDD